MQGGRGNPEEAPAHAVHAWEEPSLCIRRGRPRSAVMGDTKHTVCACDFRRPTKEVGNDCCPDRSGTDRD